MDNDKNDIVDKEKEMERKGIENGSSLMQDLMKDRRELINEKFQKRSGEEHYLKF
jgi:hypothetical protein